MVTLSVDIYVNLIGVHLQKDRLVLYKIAQIYLSSEHDKETYSNQGESELFTDVIVVFEDGEKRVATFFSYQSIEFLQKKHRESKEYLAGKYFWAPGMLLIENCSRDSVNKVIEELIKEGDFSQVFRMI